MITDQRIRELFLEDQIVHNVIDEMFYNAETKESFWDWIYQNKEQIMLEVAKKEKRRS
ncbi:MAG: hypothetical protein ACOCQR_02210 [bacterium]